MSHAIPKGLIAALCTVLLLAGWTGQGVAQTPLREYSGVVNSIDFQRQRLIVSDKSFQLMPTTRVQDPNGGDGTLLDLDRGVEVRIEYESVTEGGYTRARLVHGITVLR